LAWFTGPSTASAADVVDGLATLDAELAAGAVVDVLELVLLLLHAAASNDANSAPMTNDLQRPTFISSSRISDLTNTHAET